MAYLAAALVWIAALSVVQSTATSKLRDYSAGGGGGTYQTATQFDVSRCANVKIVETREGVIRSPFYYAKNSAGGDTNSTAFKCKWTLIAPAGQAFELTLVDYEREAAKGSCAESGRLEVKNLVLGGAANSSASLLMPFYDVVDPEGRMAKKLHRFDKNALSSCSFNFQPFTVLRSSSNVVQVEYEATATAAAAFNFFLTFSVVDSSNGNGTLEEESAVPFCGQPDEIRCEIEYNLESKSSAAQHYSCIHKDVLCNCPDASAALSSVAAAASGGILYDNCDYLMKHYRVYLDFLVKRPADYCHFYLNLNRKCRKNEADDDEENPPDYRAQAPPDADQNLDDYETETNIGDDGAGPAVKQAAALNDGLVVENNATQLCQNVIRSDDLGWIASPAFSLTASGGGGNTKYPDNLTCAYRITVRNGSTIQLRFKYYYLNPVFVSVPVASRVVNKTGAKQLPDTMSRKLQFLAERSIDYDYINIYDGASAAAPLLVHLTASQNDYMARNVNAKVFNARSNSLFVLFHSQAAAAASGQPARFTSAPVLGFNFTYQLKGQCVEDQLACNSPYEAECYSKAQRCNDVWDCHNGEDEKGCGPCPYDQYWCRNHIFCYRREDRCDGDHQCIDKSDEQNCDAWFCNSANGTFLCKNGRCIYEQWVCDGQADCDDGSDEDKCPTPLTRRVITTAVVGGTLCCLLLVMALGCACKLYTLHTVGYRTNARLSQSVQSAAAAAAASAPLIPRSATTMTTIDGGLGSLEHPTTTSSSAAGFLSSLLLRRTASSEASVDGVVPTVHSLPQSAAAGQLSLLPPPPPPPPTTITMGAGELPLPHHLIAPPTYNQTMGLVDEYEQRQLAFIEHVRSILTQQQQQQSSSASSSASQPPNAAAIPLVTTSSTTLHRVTSNTGYRRSHSSRHHRHHHHHHGGAAGVHHHSRGTSGQVSDPAPGSSTAAGGGGGVGSSTTSRHSHRHHSQSHSSRQTYDANRRGLAMLNSEPAEDQRRSSTAAMSTSFSSAAVASLGGAPLTFNLNPNSMPPLPLAANTTDSSNPNTSSSSAAQQATAFNSLVNKTSNASTNLRDRIAKLIKDIVVHHGDNIQYVQLADQLGGQQSPAAPSPASPAAVEVSPSAADMNGESVSLSSTNSTLSVDMASSPEVTADPPSTDSITDTARQPSSEAPSSSSTPAATAPGSEAKPNGAEDDVPLIQA